MPKQAPRQCQPCTACCDGWVHMNIQGVDVYPGHACPHSTGQGCDNYANRPVDPCVNFICGWVMEGSPLPEWMKPSNAKVLVLFNKLTWAGRPVDVAVPVGRRIPPRALNWLKQFAEKNLRPLIYTEQLGEQGNYSREQTVFGHGPREFRMQVAQWVESGKTLW